MKHLLRTTVSAVAVLAASVVLSGCTDSPSADGPGTTTSAPGTADQATASLDLNPSAVQSAPSAIVPGEPGEPNKTVDASVAATMFDPNEKNDADVEFATMMVPHHEQAVRLIGYVKGRTENPELLALADRMREEQSAEIAVFKAWLEQRGESELTGDDLAEHVKHMAGSISEKQFTELQAASGTAFDKIFYTLMIAHHKGAMEMADNTLGYGVNPDMHKMAADVNTSQNAQVRTMEVLLSELGR